MLQIVLWAGVLLRFFSAIWNGLYAPIASTKIDALGFQFYASDYSKNLVMPANFGSEGDIYVRFVGVIYYFFTDSFFLGCVISILVWLVSALILIRSMRLLEIDRRSQACAMCIFSLLPSVVLFTSTTLREAFQLLFVNLTLYSALKIYLKKSKIHLFILPTVVFGMGCLHSVFFVSGFILIISLLILVAFFRRKKLTLIKVLFLAPLTIVPVILWVKLIPRFHYKFSDTVVSVYNTYTVGLVNQGGRSVYKEFVPYNEVWDILLSTPFSLYQYMFEPLPWNVSSYDDLGLLFENIIRIWLVFQVMIGIKKLQLPQFNAVVLTFVFYLIIEGVWALGTANWGTAARHHVPSIGLLVVAAFAHESFLTFPLSIYQRYR